MQTAIRSHTIVLAGLESAGKSALFRTLTGFATGDELNFRGSTVVCRSAPVRELNGDVVDTPGIRVQGDSATTRTALQKISMADTVVLVVRGTNAQAELESLLKALEPSLRHHNVALAITFEDKADSRLRRLSEHFQALLGIPVVTVNAREMSSAQRGLVLDAIRRAQPIHKPPALSAAFVGVNDIAVVQPPLTIFEDNRFGALAAVITLLLMFAVPVAVAYLFSQWAQPIVDQLVIGKLMDVLAPLLVSAPFIHFILVGSYGIITLGWYSFLWAFPVVLFLGISVALAEETGVKDRITAALDPWLRRIGLNGRDLIPVLSGFGCNVVAVFQSRSCSACTRKACVSLIAFGSACSYQIGATLSLFGSAKAPALFVPYLLILFIVGAVHTRVWHRPLAEAAALPLTDRAFLQRPTLRATIWRVSAVVKQFLLQAMPIFILICAIATLLQYFGVLDGIAEGGAPALNLFGLPGNVAAGVIFSIVRKDGLLVLNQDNGALLATLTTGQVFVLVWLASTMTACMVTLWTIRKELGAIFALTVAGRQMLTSLLSTLIIALLVRLMKM